MRLKLIPLAVLLLLAGCADPKETGISRSRAISIAENHCSEFPGRFSEVDRAEYNEDGHYWSVSLTDTDGDKGRTYRISRGGVVVGTTGIDRAERRHDDDGGYYDDRPYHHWGYYW